MYLQSSTSSLLLTVAGPGALEPTVTNVSVASTSAVLKPRTVGCATTDSTGFLEGAALRAPYHMNNC